MIRVVLATCLMLAATVSARAEIALQELVTPGGTKVWLLEEHSIPFVALELRFKGGTALDEPGKEGAVFFMTSLLEEGAGDRDARTFAKERDNLAMSLSFEAGKDALAVSTRFLTEYQDESLTLLRDALTAPRFDEDAIERVRGQVISGLQGDLKDPETLATDEFDKRVFGDHAYGRQVNGTLETVPGLTRDDLIAIHKAAVSRDRVYVSAVGDISPEELSAVVDTLLADLPETPVDLPDMADPDLPGGIQVIEFDTPQSVVQFAQPGIARDHPDFFAAFVLNYVLGGGSFESRLMNEVRDKRGLTYGIYTYISQPHYASVWRGGTASANDKVAEAIAVIRDEWARIRDEGITEQELNDAKTYLTGSYPLRFDGNERIANIAAEMQVDDMPLNYIAERNDKVNAVTLEHVNRVARELIDPDALTFVVVGKPEGLETDDTQ